MTFLFENSADDTNKPEKGLLNFYLHKGDNLPRKEWTMLKVWISENGKVVRAEKNKFKEEPVVVGVDLSSDLLTAKEIKSYTIKLKEHDQDSVVYETYRTKAEWVESNSNWLDFDEILERSLRDNRIDSVEDIVSFCTGSDHIEAFFSSESAGYECSLQLEYGVWYNDDRDRPEFDENISEYNMI